MDKQQAAADIINEALPSIPFEGWNQQVLKNAAVKAGYKKTDVIRVFQGGAVEAAEMFMRSYDRAMEEALQGYYLDKMKIRERITTAVRVKLDLMEPNREAVRKAIALLSLPFYVNRSLRLLYETVDSIWYEVGDDSTDFNFYTKRLTLAGVYSSTLLFWLDDKSPGCSNTWAFLDRRIADIMAIEKIKQNFRKKFF
jgi:ubiquinone biosynthesis protein COQ9